MATLKTQPHDGDIEEFVAGIADDIQRADARRLITMMEAATGQPPRLWGTSIVGFGTYHYKYASGREGDWLALGFAPRKGKTTIYCMDGFTTHGPELKQLGSHSIAKSCLYVKRLADVDEAVLARLLKNSYQNTINGRILYL
jgi:hypothetical protein